MSMQYKIFSVVPHMFCHGISTELGMHILSQTSSLLAINQAAFDKSDLWEVLTFIQTTEKEKEKSLLEK